MNNVEKDIFEQVMHGYFPNNKGRYSLTKAQIQKLLESYLILQKEEKSFPYKIGVFLQRCLLEVISAIVWATTFCALVLFMLFIWSKI